MNTAVGWVVGGLCWAREGSGKTLPLANQPISDTLISVSDRTSTLSTDERQKVAVERYVVCALESCANWFVNRVRVEGSGRRDEKLLGSGGGSRSFVSACLLAF